MTHQPPGPHTDDTTLARSGGPSPSPALPDRFDNPGLPVHVPRRADVDEKAATRAERQVVGLFGLSVVGTLGFLVAYLLMDPQARTFIYFIGEINLYHATLGLTLGLALMGIGLGAVHWAKTLMSDEEVVEERHPQAGTDEERAKAAGLLSYGWRTSQLNRRPLILGVGGAALSLFALPLVVQVAGSLGPLPGDALSTTNWRRGLRLMIDPSANPIRPEDLTLGSVVHIMPEGFVGHDAEEELGAEALLVSKAKDQVILVRLNPDDIVSAKQRDWGVDGIVAYSKVCTHVGCPVALYERQTHHLLCPCHQSTFDMLDDCRVLFGPARRALPQLPITVDADGYLAADGGFAEPIGPSFFERGGEGE